MIDVEAAILINCARGCIAVLNGEHWPYVADKSAYNYKFIERKQEK